MVALVAIISNVDLIVSTLSMIIIYVCIFIYNLYFLPLNKYVFFHYNIYISRGCMRKVLKTGISIQEFKSYFLSISINFFIYQVDYMDSKGMKCYYVCNNYITGLFESFA